MLASRRRLAFRPGRSWFRWGDANVSVGDSAMIALQIKRSGQLFVTVQGSSRDTRDFLVVDDGVAVLDHSHPASIHRYVEGLPGPRPSRLLRVRRQETIHGA